MDKIKLAERTIALLSSMIESGETHTARSREMKDNALNGLEQLRIGAVVGRSEQLVCNPKKLDCPYEFTSRCTMGRCDCKPKAN